MCSPHLAIWHVLQYMHECKPHSGPGAHLCGTPRAEEGGDIDENMSMGSGLSSAGQYNKRVLTRKIFQSRSNTKLTFNHFQKKVIQTALDNSTNSENGQLRSARKSVKG